MVGAPRSAVTQAAGTLRRQGVIDYTRGVVTIKDQQALQKMACECFAAVSTPDACERRLVLTDASIRVHRLRDEGA